MATNTLPNGYLLNHEYKILSTLGQGGFGITYLAEDTNLGHQVVIKEFLPQSMAVRDQNHYTVTPYTQEDALYAHLRIRFIEEARLLASIRHPNVVKVTRLLESNNTAYFIMEYEEGETLEDYLKRYPTLKEQDILSIMMPILEGTKYVHAQGVLHRDIAPDNIYLKTNGMPMLIDFGAARNVIAHKSQMPSAIIKEGYSPMEQYTKNKDQAPSTDIYALGAVIYRMISGKKPITAIERQMEVSGGESDPLSSFCDTYAAQYSAKLLQAVRKALNLQQEKRFQTIETFQKSITQGEDIPTPKKAPTPKAPVTPTPKPNIKEEKSKKGIIMPILILLLLGIVGFMGSKLYLQPDKETSRTETKNPLQQISKSTVTDTVIRKEEEKSPEDILQNSLESETSVPNKTKLKPSVPSFVRTLEKNTSSNKWSTPNNSTCTNYGGTINSKGYCQSSWQSAKDICHAYGSQLPTLRNLKMISSDCKEKSDNYIECITQEGLLPDFYWSSTPYEADTDNAWSISFNSGGHYDADKDRHFYVRCIRKGQTKQETSPSNKPRYYVQIGAFNREPPPKFLKKIENAGLAYAVHRSERTRRVRVGPYESYAEAKTAIANIESLIGISGFVVKENK